MKPSPGTPRSVFDLGAAVDPSEARSFDDPAAPAAAQVARWMPPARHAIPAPKPTRAPKAAPKRDHRSAHMPALQCTEFSTGDLWVQVTGNPPTNLWLTPSQADELSACLARRQHKAA